MTAASFRLDGRVAVVTGGYGVIGGVLAAGLAAAGARVAVLGRRREVAESKTDELRRAGGEAIALVADVLDDGQLLTARDELIGRWGRDRHPRQRRRRQRRPGTER
jgi:NAD(P)-dependent dehydrogenase (short-subunit alcohol dehydrogenase family)